MEKRYDSWFNPRLIAILIWTMVLVGAAARISQLAIDRSLFLDEAFVAVNIQDLSYQELLLPLKYDQRAPAGFLWAVKFCWQAIGHFDWALRMTPLLAGIAALVVFRRATTLLLAPWAQLLAVTLMALAVPHIFYASDLKQYSTDLLVAVSAICIAMLPGRSTDSWSRSIQTGMFGLIALQFSFTATFVLAGIGACMFAADWRAFRTMDLNRISRLSLIASLWAIGFGVIYYFQCRHFAANPDWKTLWNNAFLQHPILSKDALRWFLERLFHVVSSPTGLAHASIATAFFLYGGYRLLRTQPLLLAAIVSPIGVLLVAAILNIYPFAGRVILFTTPSALLLICYGVQKLSIVHRDLAFPIICTIVFASSHWIGFDHRYLVLFGSIATMCFVLYHSQDQFAYITRKVSAQVAMFSALIVLALIPVKSTIKHVKTHLPYDNPMFFSYQVEDMKPVLEYVKKHWQTGDKIYLYSQTDVAFDFYADRYGFDKADATRGILTGLTRRPHQEIRDDLARMNGQSRVWFLLTHVWAIGDMLERDLYVSMLDDTGRRIDQIVLPEGYDAAAYLYDLSVPTQLARENSATELR